MNRYTTIGLVLSFALLAAGCSFKAPVYAPLATRVSGLQTLSAPDTKVNLTVTQSAGSTSPGICRVTAPIAMAGSETYAEYVQKALRAELAAAGIQDDNGGVKVKVDLQSVDYSSIVGSGSWDFKAKVSNEKGGSSDVSTSHLFDASWAWWSACSESANALPDATRDFAGNVFNSKAFVDALKR